MAYTLNQYNALVEAISQGAVEVQYGDKKVKYRSLQDMLAIKDSMEIDLGLKTSEIRVTVPIVDKGMNIKSEE
jgi:hypothetical protein